MKKMYKGISEKMSGITLIALIVTVIVLIIIAGISMAMIRANNGIISNSMESRYSTLIASFEEKVRLAHLNLRAEIRTNSIHSEGYIATTEENMKNIAKEVAKELGTTEIRAGDGNNSISTESYTVGYYTDVIGNSSTDGKGYIIIWYTDNTLRSSLNRDKAISKFNLIDTTKNKSQNEAVLVSVIHVENYSTKISKIGLSSFKDSKKDINLEKYMYTTVSKYFIFDTEKNELWMEKDISFEGNDYIDTGIVLFDEANSNKNFEISFKISDVASTQVNQATIINMMYENESINYPGLAFRVVGGNNSRVELVSNGNSAVKKTKVWNVNDVKNKLIKISRIDGIIYYSIDNNVKTKFVDFSSLSKFNTQITIGSSLDVNGNPWRFFNGTISELELKLTD